MGLVEHFIGLDLFQAIGISTGYFYFYFCVVLISLGAGVVAGLNLRERMTWWTRTAAVLGLLFFAFLTGDFREKNFVEYVHPVGGLSLQSQPIEPTVVPIPWRSLRSRQSDDHFPGGTKFPGMTPEQLWEVAFSRENVWGARVVILMQGLIYGVSLAFLSFLLVPPFALTFQWLKKTVNRS